jgi:hypothetical protein
VLGIAVMSLFVVLINRTFWRPLYPLRRTQIPAGLRNYHDTSLLDIHALRQTFPRADGGELLVLDGIDLHLAQGQIVGLLGRTGSGKSTLLRSIAGLMRAIGRHDYLSRPAGHGAGARHCHGVPGLCAVSLADGAGKRAARP